MKYYFIYSAGGGGGEWNALKRIWLENMKPELKKNILLKFGDIFFNHRTVQKSLVKPKIWRQITNARTWISDATGDNYCNNQSNILLDSGAAKIISWLTFQREGLSTESIISSVKHEIEQHNILEKYCGFVLDSQINSAVTFDFPDPFKVRGQGQDNRLSVVERNDAIKFIDATAEYANYIYSKIGEKTMTIINGKWTVDEYNEFIQKINYTPTQIAIGGLSQCQSDFEHYINNLRRFNLNSFEKVHFLGCAGFKKVNILKHYGYNDNNIFSADSSTIINRSFADGISKYYCYGSGRKIEIQEDNIEEILNIHKDLETPYFSYEEMAEILELVVTHQKGPYYHNTDTFNARAKIALHNSDVARKFAE